MAGDDSEEKTLPPSQKKLRDARKKGQVPKSKDLTSGVALAGALGFLMLGSASMLPAAGAMFEAASQVSAGDFDTGVARMLPVVGTAAVQSLAPLLVIVPVLVVLVSMIAMKGVPFSIEPIAPKLDKINPAQGFKKLFDMRALVELAKALFKTTVIVLVFVAVLAGGLRALTLSPSCGISCEIGVFSHLAQPLLGVAALLFVLAGAADYGLQRWLFLRDQKMSISEMKRERKDMDGDPHLKRERRRLMHEALRMAGGLGLKRATVMIHGNGGTTVGLRYKINEMPAPVIVCRARGERGSAMLAEAHAMQVAAAEDAELAEGLFRVPLGHGIPEHLFRPMALALRRAGTV